MLSLLYTAENAMRKTEKQLTPTPEQTMSIPALGTPQLNIPGSR
jgi:hypothetical protein